MKTVRIVTLKMACVSAIAGVLGGAGDPVAGRSRTAVSKDAPTTAIPGFGGNLLAPDKSDRQATIWP